MQGRTDFFAGLANRVIRHEHVRIRSHLCYGIVKKDALAQVETG